MSALADLLFPEHCAGCARLMRGSICNACYRTLPRLGNEVCPACGRPTEYGVSKCPDCGGRPAGFDLARQAARYTPAVRTLVHRFKYLGSRSSGEALAALIAELLPYLRRRPEGVTWITPGGDRMRTSGIDHGRILAEQVAAAAGLPAECLLTRERRTPAQMKLPPELRRRVLRGAFLARAPVPNCVLVVDDVFTTGSTASEAARALKAGGAAHVAVLCAARSFSD